VVGAGPVGLTIALDLAQRNVPVLVIDKKSRVSMGSRALALSYRSLEILGRLGIVDRFLRDGMAWDSGRTIYAGHEISSFRIPQVEDAQYPGLLNLQQPLIETYLIDECNRRPNIEIQWQTELISMSELDSSVALAVVGPEGGYEIAAQWVVAADGARSKVRELTGCRLEGTTYNSMFVIVDIIMKSDHPPERRCWFDPPAFPGSTVLMHKQPFNVWRIDFQVSSDLDPDDVTHPDYVIPKVDEFLRSIGETADWELEWTSVYRAHALTLPRYRKGRVLFAGDAAHLLPIFGVRGLNSGMVDAANLTWKLALVIGGEADEALLDSYDAEQRDAFAQNASFAHLSTLFMTPPSRGTLLVRDAALDLALVREEFRAVADPRYSTPVDYFEGPLIAPDSDEWGSGPASGQLVPNLRIAAGPDSAFLNDVLGQDFAVLTFGGQLDAESLGSATMIDCDPSSPLGHALDASTDSVYVIRPDRHVLLRWRDTAGRSVADAIRQAMTGRNRILEAVSDG
jgi:3-(3-hydroxy-phenyl)propionate hydroxylase